MKTFTADMTASELKIKGELAIERMKDLESSVWYASLNNRSEELTAGWGKRAVRLGNLTGNIHGALKIVVDALNDACELVAEDERHSGNPKEA